MKNTLFLLLFISTGHITRGQPADLEKFNTVFNKDLKFWKTGFTNFKLSDFKKIETVSFENINVEDFDDINNFYSLYKSLISYTPDKTKFIDIYSYQLNLVKEGNKLVAYTEIDQAICLCNLKNKTWNRILFGGFANWIEDVAWISNTKFILAGIEQNEAGERKPKIFIGDTGFRSLDIYLSNDKNCFQKNRYKAAKLKKLKIEGL